MAASIVPLDAEDRYLLRSHGLDEREIAELIAIKHNDPSALILQGIQIRAGENGDVRVAKRVGQVVGQAKRLRHLSLNVADRPALAEFCAELQSNKSIETLSVYLEHPGVDVSLFVPFLRETTVAALMLSNCSLQSVAELTGAIVERGEDALRYLSLHRTPLGDVDLDSQLALRNLRSLLLDDCGIGTIACASLANLLKDPQSKLLVLSLRDNSIGDEAVSTLVDPLAGNTTLRTLDLVGNDGISKDGWSRLLKLVCNDEDVANSNHCLFNLEIFGWGPESDATTAAVIADLGANDANLLRASLEANRESLRGEEKHAVIKRKMILCHARGDLNIVCGISPVDVRERAIDVVLLPRMLEWFAGGSNANLIQYHDPPLPEAEIGAIRLCSLYRLVRERPEMFKAVAVAVATAETPKETPVATEAMLSADVEAEVDNGGVNEGDLKDGKRRRGELGVKDGERSLAMSNKKQRVDPPSLSMSDIPLEYRMEESDGSVATQDPDESDGSNQFALLHAACGFYGRVPGVIYARATNSGGQDDDAGDAVN